MGFTRDDGAAFIGFPTNDNLTQGLIGASLSPTIAQETELFPEGRETRIDLDALGAKLAARKAELMDLLAAQSSQVAA